MRRITIWLLSTISALVLLFSYHTSTSSSAATSVIAQPAQAAESTQPTTEEPTTEEPTTEEPTTEEPTAEAPSGGTYTGDAVQTRFGPVQVEITVENGTITASEVTQVPWNDRKDQEINGRAVPVLNAEVVDAQSADIDMVSGATYTSQAYVESLQSAIDRANL